MLNITPGNWTWQLQVQPDGDERVIFLDDNGNEIHPTLADVKIMAVAPELFSIIQALANCQPHQFSALKLRAGEFIHEIHVASNGGNP